MKLDSVRCVEDAYLWLSGKFTTPIRYMEIGVCEGGSLHWALGRFSMLKITLCDTWGNEHGGTGRGSHAHIVKLLNDRLIDLGIVEFRDGDSKETVPAIHDQFDLILVDGDHTCEGALLDMLNSWRLLAPGGYMVVDDIDHVGHPRLRETCFDFASTNRCGMTFFSAINSETFGVAIFQKPL